MEKSYSTKKNEGHPTKVALFGRRWQQRGSSLATGNARRHKEWLRSKPSWKFLMQMIESILNGENLLPQPNITIFPSKKTIYSSLLFGPLFFFTRFLMIESIYNQKVVQVYSSITIVSPFSPIAFVRTLAMHTSYKGAQRGVRRHKVPN